MNETEHEVALAAEPDLPPEIVDIVVGSRALRARVADLGTQLTRDYAGRDLLLIGVLKGAVIFMADLSRAIDLPLQLDFMAVSSYGASTQSSGVVRILKDLDDSISGKDVLVVEDIVDTGLTLQYLLENLRRRDPASVRVCGLLVKERERPIDVPVDYVGFTIPDVFVVGYGLDYAGKYRNLGCIGVLDPERIRP